jgi:hypothetical protein
MKQLKTYTDIFADNYPFFCLLICLFLPLSHSNSQPLESSSFKWIVGEELTYKVKWTFIKLGELKLKILKKDTMNHRPVYHCRINVNSRPGLPFISIHDTWESYVDSAYFYSHHFEAYEKEGSHLIYTLYRYDLKKKQVEVRVEKHKDSEKEILLDSLVSLTSEIHDGLSMLYYARGFVKKKQDSKLNIIINTDFVTTDINFSATRDEIDFNFQKLNCFYLDGRLRFVGVAGIKDDFKGWFSPDQQSIPIRAKMKAFIGSVGIELIRWNNWERLKE